MSWLGFGISIFLFVFLAFPAKTSLACSTTVPPPNVTPTTPTIAEKINRYSIILEGVVISRDMQPLEVVVSRYFKGKEIVEGFQKNIDSNVHLQSLCLMAPPFGLHVIIFGYMLDNQLQLSSYTTLGSLESQDTDLTNQIIKEVGHAPQIPSNQKNDQVTSNTLQNLLNQAISATRVIFSAPGLPVWVFSLILIAIVGIVALVAWLGAFPGEKKEKPRGK